MKGKVELKATNYSENKKTYNRKQRTYYQKNREKIIKKQRAYYQKNREKILNSRPKKIQRKILTPEEKVLKQIERNRIQRERKRMRREFEAKQSKIIIKRLLAEYIKDLHKNKKNKKWNTSM